MSTIPEFYAGQGVLITGATGFIGKVVVEKLLRSCPDIGCLYLLVREKGEDTPQARVTHLLQGELFSRLRREQPNFAEKVVPVPGELTAEGLGLSQEMKEYLAPRVSIVFHIAATIKFTERLRLAVKLNVLAVKRVVEFCKSLQTCKALVHVSTAYAHTNRKKCEEKIYPASYDPEKLMELVDMIDDDMAESLTPYMVKDRPNTYTFTKSIAEYYLKAHANELPVGIIRPSIVSSSWKEPFPGWTDNFNGPIGICLGIGTGVLHYIPGDPQAVADIVPVDVVANYMIAVGWYLGNSSPSRGKADPPVFNCTSGDINPCTWGHWESWVPQAWNKTPLEKRTFRLPSCAFYNKTTLATQVGLYLKHYLPGFFWDFVSRIAGQKPILMRTYGKLQKTTAEYNFFTKQGWHWEVGQADFLMSLLSEEDRKKFSFDLKPLHWRNYIEVLIVGIKKFLMKEDMGRLDQAKTAQRRLLLRTWLFRLLWLALAAGVLVPFLNKRGIKLSSFPATLVSMALSR